MPKSAIGVRKIQPKKGGLGAKKGLGATKVKTNFADIEERATLANQMKEPVIEKKKLTEEEEEEVMTSVRLAYKDLSIMKDKEEERLKGRLDANKAKQIERLGMGLNVRSDVSHSMLSDMKTINQDQAGIITQVKQKPFEREAFDNYDEYSSFSNSSSKSTKQDFRDAMIMGFETIDTKQDVYSMFSPKEESKNHSSEQQSSSSFGGGSARNSKTASTNDYDTDFIQKKFAGAKGISSDQFFGSEQSQSSGASQMNKFQNSTAISSSDYFGDGQETTTKSNLKK